MGSRNRRCTCGRRARILDGPPDTQSAPAHRPHSAPYAPTAAPRTGTGPTGTGPAHSACVTRYGAAVRGGEVDVRYGAGAADVRRDRAGAEEPDGLSLDARLHALSGSTCCATVSPGGDAAMELDAGRGRDRGRGRNQGQQGCRIAVPSSSRCMRLPRTVAVWCAPERTVGWTYAPGRTTFQRDRPGRAPQTALTRPFLAPWLPWRRGAACFTGHGAQRGWVRAGCTTINTTTTQPMRTGRRRGLGGRGAGPPGPGEACRWVAGTGRWPRTGCWPAASGPVRRRESRGEMSTGKQALRVRSGARRVVERGGGLPACAPGRIASRPVSVRWARERQCGQRPCSYCRSWFRSIMLVSNRLVSSSAGAPAARGCCWWPSMAWGAW